MVDRFVICGCPASTKPFKLEWMNVFISGVSGKKITVGMHYFISVFLILSYYYTKVQCNFWILVPVLVIFKCRPKILTRNFEESFRQGIIKFSWNPTNVITSVLLCMSRSSMTEALLISEFSSVIFLLSFNTFLSSFHNGVQLFIKRRNLNVFLSAMWIPG